MGFYQDTPWHKACLRRLCAPYQVVILALEEHRKSHGKYPPQFEALDPSLAHSQQAFAAMKRREGFSYQSEDGTNFRIFKKLNSDGGVAYSNQTSEWFYWMNDDVSWPLN